MNLKIIALECAISPAHLFINAKSTISCSKTMYYLKGRTSRMIGQEFDKSNSKPGLWTRNYFVFTAKGVSSETIKKICRESKNVRKRGKPSQNQLLF